MKQIVCDRCGTAFKHDSRDIRLYSVRVVEERGGEAHVSSSQDLCTDCAGFVIDACKLACAPTNPAPTREELNSAMRGAPTAAHYVPKWGPITYQDCGCDVRDHAPGECAKTTVMPPKGFAPAAPLPMCGECGRHHSPGHCAFFPEQPRAPFSNCTMASCESPLNCCEAGKCCG